MVYTCGSYRCPSPQCQKKAASTDFARISKALEDTDGDESKRLRRAVDALSAREKLATEEGLDHWAESFAEQRRKAEGETKATRRGAGWVFMVLTLDSKQTLSKINKPYKDEQDAFKRLSLNTRLFLRRLRKHQRQMGWRETGAEWCGTVEVQRNGWPHMNLIIYSPEMANELRENQEQGPAQQQQAKASSAGEGVAFGYGNGHELGDHFNRGSRSRS